MPQKILRQKFRIDLNKISSQLIEIFKLKHSQDIKSLDSSFLRWLDFRMRYIAPKKRKIIYSNQFPKTQIPGFVQEQLLLLEQKILQGVDINPHQGKGLINYHDTSSKKPSDRTDLLWADWGIHHLHLENTIIPNEYFLKRGDWLLFCLVQDEYIAFIDILSHKKENEKVFSTLELMKIINQNWPEFMNHYKLHGILPSNNMQSSFDIDSLRKHGITTTITIDNETYIAPGLGVSSARTSTKVSLAMIQAYRAIDSLASIVLNSESQFQKELVEKNIINPVFTLELTPRGLAVYESSLSTAFLLPRKIVGGQLDFLGDLHELICPTWALNRVTGER